MKNILIYSVILLTCGCACRTDPGSGSKRGIIVHVSEQGMIWKTWEATLVRGGLSDGTGVMGGNFEFTIPDTALALKAIKFMESQEEVIIDYHMEGISSSTRSESSNPNFCDRIRKANNH